MIENISIQLNEEHKLPLMTVKGEVDIYTCGKLRSALANLIESNSSDFILDLNEIIYIDSTGLGTIAHIARSIEKNKATIHILCNKPQIKKIFEVSGLEQKNITLYEELNEIESINESNK